MHIILVFCVAWLQCIGFISGQVSSYELVRTLPHDSQCFTQGLLIHKVLTSLRLLTIIV